MTQKSPHGGHGKSRHQGKRLQWLNWVVIGAVIILAIIVNESSGETPFWLVLVGVGAIAASYWVSLRAEQHLAPEAEELLRTDSRRPVLYLRSFSADSTFATNEQPLLDVLSEIGPVVAVGQPGEWLPPPGIARLYVDEEGWQDKVLEIMERARLVFFLAGSTPGLSWELKQCRTVLDPRRIIVLVVDDKAAFDSFSKLASQSAELDLPPYPSRQDRGYMVGNMSGMITFDRSWKATYQPFPKAALRGANNPTWGADHSARFRLALEPICNSLGIPLRPAPTNVLKGGMTTFFIVGFAILVLIVIGFATGILR